MATIWTSGEKKPRDVMYLWTEGRTSPLNQLTQQPSRAIGETPVNIGVSESAKKMREGGCI